MVVALATESPPLRQDESGALRIGNSRVLLEIVIHAFRDGVTAEDICRQYPTVSLGEVYAVIGYYLRHERDIEAYLESREAAAAAVEERISSQQADLSEIRARLMARRSP